MYLVQISRCRARGPLFHIHAADVFLGDAQQGFMLFGSECVDANQGAAVSEVMLSVK